MENRFENLVKIVKERIILREKENKMLFNFCRDKSDVLLALGSIEWMEMLEEAGYSDYRKAAFYMYRTFVELMDKVENAIGDLDFILKK